MGLANLRKPRVGLLRIDPPILIVMAFLLAVVLTGFFVNERFGTFHNFMNVLEQSSALGFVSLGQTVVVLTGGIDLSVGAVVTASSVLLAGMVDSNHELMWPMLVCVLLAGAIFGAMNGIIILHTGVHPLVVTLGTATLLNGLALLYTLQPTGSAPFWFEEFAYGRNFGLPTAGLVMLAAFVIIGIFLKYAPLGRAIYSVGGNPEAARLSGIRSGRVTIAAYAISGFFAAVAGAWFVSRTGVGDPRIGEHLTLASIAPVIIGGALLTGGRGGVGGTLLGVLLLSFLNNLLNYINVSTFIQWVIQGLIIIAAVSIYVNRGGQR